MAEEYVFNVNMESSEETFSPQLEFDNYSFLPDLEQVIPASSGVHEELVGRDKPNQHPIEAISGLRQELTTIVDSLGDKVTTQVVSELPENPSETVIYVLPNPDPESENHYIEYIYVNNQWELLGATQVDLSDYYTQEEVDSLLDTKQDRLSIGTGIIISNDEISIDTDTVAQKTDIHNPTITFNQGGSTVAEITLNQILNQTIDLGRSGDWFQFIAIPFTEDDELAVEKPAYWKITSPDLIEYPTIIKYYSGEEIQNLINNHNCYVSIIESIFFHAPQEILEFYAFEDMDANLGKIHKNGFHSQSRAFAKFIGHNKQFSITVWQNEKFLQEAIAYMSLLISGDNGVMVDDRSGEYIHLDLQNLEIDCGTSTSNI